MGDEGEDHFEGVGTVVVIGFREVAELVDKLSVTSAEPYDPVLDVRNLNLDKNFAVGIDQQEYLKVASKGNRVIIEPKGTNVMRHFKQTRKSLVRTHVMVSDEETESDSALIVVRIRDCIK